MDIERYRNWTGSGDELVQIAGGLLTQDMRTAQQTPPNLRVLRDYQQRQIVSAPERKGREAVYGFQHLIQFLAARVLVADNWPLRKIAETLPHMGDSRLASLLEAQSFRSGTDLETGDDDDDNPKGLVAGMMTHIPTDFDLARDQHYAEPDRFADLFGKDADRVLQKRSDYREFRAIMAPGVEPPKPTGRISFEILPWIDLIVDAEEVESLTFDEADMIGKGVTATLYRFMTKETD